MLRMVVVRGYVCKGVWMGREGETSGRQQRETSKTPEKNAHLGQLRFSNNTLMRLSRNWRSPPRKWRQKHGKELSGDLTCLRGPQCRKRCGRTSSENPMAEVFNNNLVLAPICCRPGQTPFVGPSLLALSKGCRRSYLRNLLEL